MNKTYLLLFTFFIFPLSFLLAQQSYLKTKYGEQTYNQYLEENWSELIDTGNEALNKGVDFYYLSNNQILSPFQTYHFFSKLERVLA